MKEIVSLVGRVGGLILRNPRIILTALRMDYRHRFGISEDRHSNPEFSGPPVNLTLNLTMRCNLRCRMCRGLRHQSKIPASRGWYAKERELPLEAWAALFDQVKPFRPWLYLTGGEPLLYPHFQDVVREAKKRHLAVQLQTNGTMLAEHAEFLVDMGVEAVTISLDGPPEIHEAIRGLKGAFRSLAAGARTLVAAREKNRGLGPLLSFNCTISRANLGRVHEVVPLAVDLGADILQIQHTMFNTAANVARHNRCFSPDRLQALDLKVPQPPLCDGENYQSELQPEDLPILWADLKKARSLAKGRLKLALIPDLPESFLEPYYFDLNFPFPNRCSAFWQLLRVLPDGTVSPCLNFLAGNITRQPVMEIWNGQAMRDLRRLINKGLFPGCGRCCHLQYTKTSRAF